MFFSFYNYQRLQANSFPLSKAKQTKKHFETFALQPSCDMTFHNTAPNRLAVYKEKESGLKVYGGRIHIFNKEGTTVLVRHYKGLILTLLAQEGYKVNHEEIAGTLLRMRTKPWDVRSLKLAKTVVDSCVICREARARKCQQIIGDFPREHTQPTRPFELTTVDLFGHKK